MAIVQTQLIPEPKDSLNSYLPPPRTSNPQPLSTIMSQLPAQQPLISFRTRTTLPPINEHSASFGTSQSIKPAPINFSRRSLRPHHCLDREESGKQVDRLLILRRNLMREARKKGDINEVYRLLSLGLFDTLKPQTERDEGQGMQGDEKQTLDKMVLACNEKVGRRLEHAHYTTTLTDEDIASKLKLMKPLPSLPAADMEDSDTLALGSSTTAFGSASTSPNSTSAAALFLDIAHEPIQPVRDLAEEYDPWLDLAASLEPAISPLSRKAGRNGCRASASAVTKDRADSSARNANTPAQDDMCLKSKSTTAADMGIHPAFRR